MSHLLIRGDALRIPLADESVDAVVTDPPYGMNWDPNSRRFSGGVYGELRYGGNGDRGMGRKWKAIDGDDKPFDPSRWLSFRKVILWGANHYAASLPLGTSLIWIKKADHLFGTFLSDAEIGWMKGGYGVYCFRKPFPPPCRMQEGGGKVLHPNQKPISLMRWCIEQLKLEPGSTILDPYMGSGTVGIAAMQLGFNFVGVEKDPVYVAIASRRIERPHARPIRPETTEYHPLFGDLP